MSEHVYGMWCPYCCRQLPSRHWQNAQWNANGGKGDALFDGRRGCKTCQKEGAESAQKPETFVPLLKKLRTQMDVLGQYQPWTEKYVQAVGPLLRKDLSHCEATPGG